MTVYVVIKVAKHETGDWVAATTEAVYTSKDAALAYLQANQIAWDEEINGSICFCERAIHESYLQ